MKQPTQTTLKMNLAGPVGRSLQAVTDQWLLIAPLSNPAMLEIFADRDIPPYRNMMPWAGEFAGKYLTAAVQVYHVTRDPRLFAFLERFVAQLVQMQSPDGYLGPWPGDSRLTNYSAHHGQDGLQTWDTWGHYHVMIGLMLWVEETGSRSALDCACRIGDLICEKYLGSKPVRLVDTGFTEMNLAPVHSLAGLYRLTGAQRYLDMALQIVDEFAAQGESGWLAGDYLRQALAGKEFYEMPRPRWESLHSILGLAELFRVTGEAKYKQAFEAIWWSIVAHDRHNNGGFSSGEQATGNPYDPGAIETCCTIAWTAMSVEMLKLSGNSIAADEIELSTLNSILGMHSSMGRWATYSTPMDGARFASSHAIVFQARSGSPELNCCSVNSPRGLGLISEWALVQNQDGLAVNYYGPGEFQAVMGSGQTVRLSQETDYPISGSIRLTITPEAPLEFKLRLRVPYWSQTTHLSLNHQSLDGVQPGAYFDIKRVWQAGDCIEIELDMSPHFWRGEMQCEGLVSIFRGPLLLAYDQRYNRGLAPAQDAGRIPDDPFKVTRDLLPVPVLDASQSTLNQVEWEGWHAPILLVEAVTEKGQPVSLCDFASAGATGTLYRSWLPMLHTPSESPYSRSNPLRSRH